MDSEKRWGLLPSVIEFSRHILVSIESCLRCKRLKVMFTQVGKQQQKDTEAHSKLSLQYLVYMSNFQHLVKPQQTFLAIRHESFHPERN